MLFDRLENKKSLKNLNLKQQYFCLKVLVIVNLPVKFTSTINI